MAFASGATRCPSPPRYAEAAAETEQAFATSVGWIRRSGWYVPFLRRIDCTLAARPPSVPRKIDVTRTPLAIDFISQAIGQGLRGMLCSRVLAQSRRGPKRLT